MAFGLGAGACFFYFSSRAQSPSRFTNGRTARLEEQFRRADRGALRMDTAEDPERSWELAREAVDAGRPALLLTDLYYLDHYGKSAHFPGHAVVLAGYDDELAYLSDTAFEELQTTRLENLAEARHSQHPAYPLAGHMFTGPDGGRAGDLREAAPPAIERAVQADDRAALRRVPGPSRAASGSPTRSASGRREPRTGSGARASSTR